MLRALAMRVGASSCYVTGLGSTAGLASTAMLRVSACPQLPPAPLLRRVGLAAGQRSGVPGGPSAVAARSYAYDAPAAAASSADIEEVDFDLAAANSVRLIGIVGNKREMKVFERSKLLPFSIGLKDKRRPDDIEWVNVEAWGPLAERADQRITKGDRVAVQGFLKVDSWADKVTGAKRTAFKVVANSIAKVRPTYAPFPAAAEEGATAYGGNSSEPGAPPPWDQQPAAGAPWDSAPQAGQQVQQAQQSGDLSPTEEMWMRFFESPGEWYDNRNSKTNPKAPDFKMKAGGRDAPALWLSDRNKPIWVDGALQQLDKMQQQGFE